jgi:hypothetical protein
VSEEQEEPTNYQLANFLAVQAEHDPRMEGLSVDAATLEFLLDRNPIHRQAALKAHKRFTDGLANHLEKVARGQVQCEHISERSGKRCPNFNEPGSYYCGLHKGEEDGSAAS